jgi:hypothetical protein
LNFFARLLLADGRIGARPSRPQRLELQLELSDFPGTRHANALRPGRPRAQLGSTTKVGQSCRSAPYSISEPSEADAFQVSKNIAALVLEKRAAQQRPPYLGGTVKLCPCLRYNEHSGGDRGAVKLNWERMESIK